MANVQSPMEARDELVKCFVDAQFDKIHDSAKRLGGMHSREDVERMIALQVKEAFARVGADFDAPRREDFPRVMEVLAQKALAMGKSTAEVEAHRKQMEAVLARLK